MAALGKNRPIQPSQTAERQVDSTNRDVRISTQNIQQNIVLLSQAIATLVPSVMPLDGLTDYFWPCDEESTVAVTPTIAQLAPGKDFPLLCAPGAVPGFMSEIGGRCLRIGGGSAAANLYAYTGGTALPVPAYGSASISMWVWPGRGPTATQELILTHVTAAGATHFGLVSLVNTTGHFVPQGFAAVGAGTVTAPTTIDSYLSTSAWHHIGLTYNSPTLTLYLDGRPAATATSAGGPINWTAGSAVSSWTLGTIVGVPAAQGFYRDIRIHSAARPAVWFEEAYLRGKGRFGNA